MGRRSFCGSLGIITALTAVFVVGTVAQAPTYPDPARVNADFRRLLARPAVPLDPRFAETRTGRIVESRGTFASEAGKRVPTLVVRNASSSGRLPVVIALHGTGGNKDEMRDWLRELALRGYLAVALDARYHGDWVPGGAHGATSTPPLRSSPGAVGQAPRARTRSIGN